MNYEMLNAIIQEDMGELASMMIKPQLHFVGESTPYEVDLDKRTVDAKNRLIRIDGWMNDMLHFDEFSRWVNRILYVTHAEADVELAGSDIIEYLSSLGIEVDDLYHGYTYNDGGECRLNRDIDYMTFTYDNEAYIIFSVHYGSDARDGFGDYACFNLNDADELVHSFILQVYDSKTGEEFIGSLEDDAEYNENLDCWISKETGNEIYVNCMADAID